MSKKAQVSIRGVDREVFYKARIIALEQKKTIGQFVTEALVTEILINEEMKRRKEQDKASQV